MPIPATRSVGLEFLKQIADGKRHSVREVREKLIKLFKITPEESKRRLPGGSETVVTNRLRNAKFRISSQGLAKFEESDTVVFISEGGKAIVRNASGQ